MKLRITWLVALVFVVGFAALAGSGGLVGRAQVRGCGAVRQDVKQALAGETEVSVIVSLQAADGSLGNYSIAETQQITAEQQARLMSALTGSDFTLTYQPRTVPALAGLVTASGVDTFDCHPDVLSVGLNNQGTVALAESVPLIRASEVHLQGLDGTGVNVAVFDTGIDTDHPDLADNLIGEACFTDIPPGKPCPDDPAHPNYSPGHPAEDTKHGHGTHVSGIITSNGLVAPIGVAPNANIFAYKVLGDHGLWLEGWLLAALDDVLTNHVTSNVGEFQFINMSFRLDPIPTPLQSPAECRDYNPAISQAIEQLRAVETLTIAASGNSGDKSITTYPACIPAVVSVGAVYDANLGQRVYEGLCTDVTTAADQVACFSQSADWLDLLAPGCDILSTWHEGFGVNFLCGTSMASPHAVGVGALLKQALPGLTPDDVVNRLKSTGTWIRDEFNDGDPATFRWTPRVDARVALLTNDALDFDGDGCSNGREFGDNPALGGLRNPLDPWDFFEPTSPGGGPPDGTVDLFNDIVGVIQHFGQRAGNPGYDPAFDRGPSNGFYIWNKSAPDGIVDLFNDIVGVIGQFGHNCG